MLSQSRGIESAKRDEAGPKYSAESMLVIVCATLALCNAVELLTLIFMTFKRCAGLYFWSILLASFGVLPYCAGWLIVYFDITHDYVVVLFGSPYSPHESRRGFNAVFNVLEKVQMTCFCMQELIISGIYIWKTIDILKTALGNTRRILWQLFAINLIIVIMDFTLLIIEYKNFYVWEQGIKVVTCSIKLKLEFAVLGELIDFICHRGGTQSGSNRDYRNTSAFVELSAVRKDDNKDSCNKTYPVRRKDTETNKVIVASNTVPDDAASDEIRVVTRVDVESLSTFPRDDQSTDELYDHTIAKSTEIE
ncbi:hypothetical protein FOXB_17448 [Fusarium oxysporum f. sp. conglutinans Fo5176]|uniref:DUF7703 domain-containing protein n=1 Tax=Fusarium oxysporum (strain Fo5176) TaxID=660025 RepID=F9GFL4_FUSOF|nr:hypothetical protein FOXB_17448 [Fusarium oxysporum f. sp. conglutinans Fo5176]